MRRRPHYSGKEVWRLFKRRRRSHFSGKRYLEWVHFEEEAVILR